MRRSLLRAVRRLLAASIGWLVAAFPSLEPALVRLGRAGRRRSRLLAGLYWFAQESLLARLRKHGERFRTVFVAGHRLQLDITDETGRYPFFYGTPYEAGVTDAIITALKPGDVFIDVGANVGYFAVLAAAIVGPLGQVVAFEPNAAACEALEETLQRNEAIATVNIVPVGLAEVDGTAVLFIEQAVTRHSTIEPGLSPMREVAALRPAEVVRVITLDGWMKQRPNLSGRVRCVKIDVEGAEARVLAGMAGTLRAEDVTVVCETILGSPADRILTSAGFQMHRLEASAAPYGNFLYVRP